MDIKTITNPSKEGFFGKYGGTFVPETITAVLEKITAAYEALRNDPKFLSELQDLREHYVGRPSPVYKCTRLSEKIGGASIYLKREDCNHTGAHKINHCIGEGLLAKYMGCKKVIAETGAGAHGVALSTAAALLGLECDIYMGAIDMAKQAPNVQRMQLLGTKVIPVTTGGKTLKDAVDAAFIAWLADHDNILFAIGSVVGPHPFPMMVRDFQEIVGIEARKQMLDYAKTLPDAVVACVGGGSNAMGIFSGFLADEKVRLIGVEPGGIGTKVGEHAATMTYGTEGIIHGFKTLVLQDEKGEPLPVHSVASGLDYPGVGPQHSYLKEIKRAEYEVITDKEAINAFYTLSRIEGIVPALESSHALAFAMKMAKTMSSDQKILVNLSGRGDKDIDYVLEKYPCEENFKM